MTQLETRKTSREYLVDINVLIAQLDADHEHHERTVRWWHRNVTEGWATCPIIEYGFVRILGRPSYPCWPGTVDLAANALQRLILALPGHRFFSDQVSLLESSLLSRLGRVTPSQVTDLYLLALAVHYKAKFVSNDRRTPVQWVAGGKSAYVVIR